MAQQKMGGQEALRIFLKGNHDLIDSTLSLAEGGGKLSSGLKDLVRQRYGDRFRIEVVHEPCGDSSTLRRELEAAISGRSHDTTTTRLFEEAPDVVAFSLHAEVVDLEGAEAPERADAQRFTEDMLAVVRLVKERLGAHVIFLNASTVDPGDIISNYWGLSSDTPSVRAHKLDLALMELSFLEGISIVDADRLLAELGAAQHIQRPLDYSPEACEVICREFLRVLDDYGFFEERPLIMQVGQREGRG